MKEKYGIKKIEKAIKIVCKLSALAESFGKKKPYLIIGKILSFGFANWKDLRFVIKNRKDLLFELKDIDPSEMRTLQIFFNSKFDLQNNKLELKVEKWFAIIEDIVNWIKI